jgi:hypothetical protein
MNKIEKFFDDNLHYDMGIPVLTNSKAKELISIVIEEDRIKAIDSYIKCCGHKLNNGL